jgi:hypothetical protein
MTSIVNGLAPLHTTQTLSFSGMYYNFVRAKGIHLFECHNVVDVLDWYCLFNYYRLYLMSRLQGKVLNRNWVDITESHEIVYFSWTVVSSISSVYHLAFDCVICDRNIPHKLEYWVVASKIPSDLFHFKLPSFIMAFNVMSMEYEWRNIIVDIWYDVLKPESIKLVL